MAECPHPAWANLEPNIVSAPSRVSPSYFETRPGEHEIELSKAISLKRIADVLAPAGGQDVGSTLFYIEQRLSQAVLR